MRAARSRPTKREKKQQVALYAGRGETVRETDGKPGTSYTVRHVVLASGAVVTRQQLQEHARAGHVSQRAPAAAPEVSRQRPWCWPSRSLRWASVACPALASMLSAGPWTELLGV